MCATLVIFLAIFGFSDAKATDLRIIGGRLAREGEFPYQVALRRSYNNYYFCGGSIITPKHILTAAHCMYYVWGGLLPPFMVSVTAGQLGVTITPTSINRNASKITVHPDYDRKTMANDLAIVELEEELPLNNKSIAEVVLNTQNVTNNTFCTVSGWGVQKYESLKVSENLLATEVYTVDFQECQKRYNETDVQLFEGMLCAANDERITDACQGDSGGPLVCGGVLTGVISTGNECANPKYPGIYSDVQYFLPWIKTVVNFTEFETNTALVTHDVTATDQNVTDAVTDSNNSMIFEQARVTVIFDNSNSNQYQFIFFPIPSNSSSLSAVALCHLIVLVFSLIL